MIEARAVPCITHRGLRHNIKFRITYGTKRKRWSTGGKNKTDSSGRSFICSTWRKIETKTKLKLKLKEKNWKKK
jgi:hypothetical protein